MKSRSSNPFHAMVNELVSAVLQVTLFTAIPFVVYFIKTKKMKGFGNYIGLKKSTRKANLLALLLVTLTVPMLVLGATNPQLYEVITDTRSVTGRIREMGAGVDAMVVILIAALVKTSLSEEILFRGFLAKRIIALTNFQTGNIVQACIFGAIHPLLFLSVTDNAFFLLIVFLFPAVGAYFQTYLNEKVAGGSILPGWISHGLSNVVAYTFFAFIV